MTGWRGIFAGVLTLVALEAVVSTSDAASRTAGLFGAVAGIAQHLLDPNVAAIPDRTANLGPPIITNPSTYQQPAPTPANRKPRPRVVVV